MPCLRDVLRPRSISKRIATLTCFAALMLMGGAARAQRQTPDAPSPAASSENTKAANATDAPVANVQPASAPQQTKRILGIIPNYRAVSADTHLPPLAFKEKFWLATQDSFDYSSFVYVGILSGISVSEKSQPSFGDGASSLADYYAHNLADNTIENYQVETFVPALTKEDPRYYTLGHGGVFKRTGYALSRLLITRTDSGDPMLNLSEIVGAGAAAGISNIYYPPQPNPFVKTYQLWISEIAQDGISNIAKEFWPDINHTIFRRKN
jgi:hypothetical protein